MSWLAFVYMVFAVILGFFAGYYFIVANLLRNQIIHLNNKLEATYELMNFFNELNEEPVDSED